MSIKHIITYLKQNWIKIATLFLIITLSIIKLTGEERPYATGDAIEYTLMTEALKNHFSPDVRISDCESFKKSFTKTAPWESNDKAGNYDAVQVFIATENLKKLQYNYAFFVDKNGKKYSVHFFIYSLFNLPASKFCSLAGINPLYGFAITNALLIIVSCFLFFRFSPFSKNYTSLFVLLFFYSSGYWYLCWEHPEVFTICFSSLGLWLFLNKNYYLGTFLVSVAALQNQPLAIVVGALSLATILINGINLRNIYKTARASFLIFIPSLFYFYHFGVSNLIKYQGALSFKYVSFTRVFGFFFDLNQGVVLAIPFLLFVYFGLILVKISSIKKEYKKIDLYIPLALVLTVCFAATIDNWNSGQTVISRYATYVSGAILVHSFFMIMQIEKAIIRNIILFISLSTQIATVYYHQSISKFDYSTNEPKPISNWILTNHPSLYNPDPIIFIARYAKGIADDPSLSPGYFMKEDGEITKILVHKNYINNLISLGFSQRQIDSIAPTLKFIMEWAYIDINKNFTSSFSNTDLKKVDNERKIKNQIDVIKNSREWLKTVQDGATKHFITIEEALRRNAAFVMGIQIEIKMSREERIESKKEEIKSNVTWLHLIEEKAKKYNISLDSALFLDAAWEVDKK